LLNHSNHPITEWSHAQLARAEELFGKVDDMPFPQISPSMNETSLLELCQRQFEIILSKKPSAVHIMGEQNYCFILIQLLLKANMPCYASTTKRITAVHANEKKTTFKFVDFRMYKLIDQC
jgi:hypothetical protein